MSYYDLECEKIELLESDVRRRKAMHLRNKGWKYSSDTIGSYWMWFKTIPQKQYRQGILIGSVDKHYGCSTEDAFRIQSTIDRSEYFEAHPEEEGD